MHPLVKERENRGNKDISIIIVSYNTVDLIGTCLDSVYGVPGIDEEIFVIDNASSDGSVDFIRDHYPEVNLIANAANRGFAAANNQVLPECRGKYILFLNPDAEITGDAMEKMIAHMDKHPHTGLAGTKIVYPDGSLQWSVSYQYPGQRYTGETFSKLPGTIAAVLGASMIARSEIIKELGGFDEDFFLYGEDQDLCLRIRKEGYEIGYIESAIVVHHGGRSEGNSSSDAIWRKKIRAEYILYRKHYPPSAIKRIIRAYKIKCLWRITTMKLAIPFLKNRAIALEKLTKYETILTEIQETIR